MFWAIFLSLLSRGGKINWVIFSYVLEHKIHFHEGVNGLISLFRAIDRLQALEHSAYLPAGSLVAAGASLVAQRLKRLPGRQET